MPSTRSSTPGTLKADGTTRLTDLQFFLFFAALMFVTACVFSVVANFYRGKTYLQGNTNADEADIAAATNMPA